MRLKYCDYAEFRLLNDCAEGSMCATQDQIGNKYQSINEIYVDDSFLPTSKVVSETAVHLVNEEAKRIRSHSAIYIV